MKRVVLHVDKLLLKGFRREDRHSVVESLRNELGRQFHEPGAVKLIASRSNVARINIPSLRVPAVSKPGHVGTRVARGIARSMKS